MEQANAIVFESQTCFYSPYIDRQVALLSKEKDIQVSLRYACSGFGIFDRYLGVSWLHLYCSLILETCIVFSTFVISL